MLEAVIFDMDGVIIDSEHIWRKVEIDAFSKLGVLVTEDDMRRLTGLRSDLLIDTIYSRQPWEGKSKEELDSEIKDAFIKEIENNAIPMAGVIRLLNELSQLRIPMAVCSSSARRIIEYILVKLEIRDKFEFVISTEEVQYAKPHPEAYIRAIDRLNVNVIQTVIIEDSLNGCIAAKASRAKVLAVPDKNFNKRSVFDFCDFVTEGLSSVNYKLLSELVSI